MALGLEGSSAVEEDEDDSGAGDGDQRQGGKVGDQVNVKAHDDAALSENVSPPRLRGSAPRARYSFLAL